MTNKMLEIRVATCDSDYAIAKNMFIAYQQYLGVDLCFQSFDEELNILPEMYGPPEGVLLLAYVNNAIAGCVALRNKQQGVCEMKRLYVLPEARGLGLGLQLATQIVEHARLLGYQKMVLDTLDRLVPALTLYEKIGFTRCAPYYANPLQGVVFMEHAF